MNTDPKVVYEFGPFRMDPDKQVLLRDGQLIAVTPKAFETLLVLVRRGREVVSKEELLKEVWPDSFVEEANLSQHIFKLRKALGDTLEGEHYIVTLPGRSYRFAVPVRTITEGGEVLIAADALARPDCDRGARAGARRDPARRASATCALQAEMAEMAAPRRSRCRDCRP